MGKRFIFSLLVFSVFAFVFGGNSYAGPVENPFKELTQDQVIQKYFEGRQLDPVEGIWLNEKLKPVVIVKANLIDNSNTNNYDYFRIEYSSSAKINVVEVNKTQYPNNFECGKYKELLRYVSPTTLMLRSSWQYDSPLYDVYTRLYPSELK